MPVAHSSVMDNYIYKLLTLLGKTLKERDDPSSPAAKDYMYKNPRKRH